MDPNTLFKIFEQGDEQIYKEYGQQDVLENPYVLMGTVLRGIENWILMDEMYSRRYPEQYKEVRNKVRWKYNIRLFSYLERINLDDSKGIYKIGENFPKKGIANGLNHLIRYFERYEEYEKCGVIKKYLDKIIMAELELD
tara:strand:- start:132 stop:551 length:420 start_codon:yes stop_codon:yes gene_type:complete